MNREIFVLHVDDIRHATVSFILKLNTQIYIYNYKRESRFTNQSHSSMSSAHATRNEDIEFLLHSNSPIWRFGGLSATRSHLNSIQQ